QDPENLSNRHLAARPRWPGREVKDALGDWDLDRMLGASVASYGASNGGSNGTINASRLPQSRVCF
ncbi:unnamed protein product, partial [Protopolystoma xenopodis]